MGRGTLAVVEDWLEAVSRGDGRRVEELSAVDIQLVGPRGSVRGRGPLSEWLGRAGFSARSSRWFCGADGNVVVEQEARWVDPATGVEQGRAVVASRLRVQDGRVDLYARHGDLRQALGSAGLTIDDEAVRPGPAWDGSAPAGG